MKEQPSHSLPIMKNKNKKSREEEWRKDKEESKKKKRNDNQQLWTATRHQASHLEPYSTARFTTI